MKQQNANRIISISVVAGLLLLAALIWSRIAPGAVRTDPTAAWGLVIAVFLARPGGVRERLVSPAALPSVAATVLLAAGCLTELIFLQGLGWSVLGLVLCRSCFELRTTGRLSRLIPVMLFAFPWIASDLPGLSWIFRVSAAAFAANVFSVGGFEVTRSELGFCVEGMMVRVTPDCSGMIALQSMMMLGAAATYRFFPRSDCYWLVMAFLPAVAWLANALRVVALTALALVTNIEFVSRSAHTIVGIIVILGSFVAFLVAVSRFARVENLGRS